MDDPLKSLSQFYKKRIEDAQAESEAADKIIKEFQKKMPAIQDYFYGYSPFSVEQMVYWYAVYKINFSKSARFYLSKYEETYLVNIKCWYSIG